MKVISLNIRGFKRDGKKEWVKKICSLEKPCFLALQETKCKEVSDGWVEELWGNKNFGFAQKESNGRAGGILSLWDVGVFLPLL